MYNLCLISILITYVYCSFQNVIRTIFLPVKNNTLSQNLTIILLTNIALLLTNLISILTNLTCCSCFRLAPPCVWRLSLPVVFSLSWLGRCLVFFFWRCKVTMFSAIEHKEKGEKFKKMFICWYISTTVCVHTVFFTNCVRAQSVLMLITERVFGHVK